MLRTDLTFRVTSAVFKIAGEMHWLPAYFDNPDSMPLGGERDYGDVMLSRPSIWSLTPTTIKATLPKNLETY